MAMVNGVDAFRGFLMALDPVHVGTGAYRLGRVDLPILREPGTNLPKVPGTTLSGMARAYSALRINGGDRTKCSGQGKNHCREAKCRVCYTFGTVGGGEDGSAARQKSYAGVANIFDARLLFFPVATMCGPVWVTSPSALEFAGYEPAPQPPPGQALFSLARWASRPLNLGWILMDTASFTPAAPPRWGEIPAWGVIKDRIVIVEDSIFSQVVNSNLEVRTSVTIDQETGAASDKGLFTYEALPRSTWLCFPLIIDDYRRSFPANGDSWSRPEQVVSAGIEFAEYLGLGGMGTRGFGRVKLLSLMEAQL